MSLLVEKLHPMGDWLIVKRDPVQPRSSIIVSPNDEGSAVRTGVVLRVGPGKLQTNGVVLPVDVQVGEHIAFLRWHHEHRPGKANTAVLRELAAELGTDDDVVLVRENDILFAFEGECRMDIA